MENVQNLEEIKHYIFSGPVQQNGLPGSLRKEFMEVIKQGAPDTNPTVLDILEGTMIGLQNKHRQLEAAGFDPLTNALNLKGMQEQIGKMERYRAREYAAVFIDLDGFKELNDNCGHEAGDQALKEVISRLSESLFKKDLIVRKGGDEVVLILQYNEDDRFDEDFVREKVRESLAGLHKIGRNGQAYPIGASIGTVSIDGERIPSNVLLTEAVDILIQNADARMYDDKWGPNNQYKTDDGKHPMAPKNIRLAELRAALTPAAGPAPEASI